MSKLVFITGASSGLGQALALRFHQAGYRLALVARRTDEIKTWASAHQISADRYRIYSADVAVIDSIVAAGQQCIAEMGAPDVVIANAGVSIGVDLSIRSDVDVLRDTLAINNVGLAATFHPFINAMCERGNGRLVGIASVAGIRGLPGHPAYCASKAAVISLCESLRVDMNERAPGVRVVTIVPGYVDTPLTRGNTYPMPFIISSQTFADRAFAAIESGTSYRVIPWQMGIVSKLMRLLPNWLYDKAVAGRGRKKRLGE
jgi:short-subunit dehydrogenase